jgi:hypothetical protein
MIHGRGLAAHRATLKRRSGDAIATHLQQRLLRIVPTLKNCHVQADQIQAGADRPISSEIVRWQD